MDIPITRFTILGDWNTLQKRKVCLHLSVQNSVHLPLQTLQEHHEETQNWLLSVGQYHLFSRLDVAVSGACRLTSKPLSTTVEVTWKYFSL